MARGTGRGELVCISPFPDPIDYNGRVANQVLRPQIKSWKGLPLRAQTTQTLVEVTRGDASAADRLVSTVYDELRALAARFLQNERPDHTLQPTALAHEVYLKLIDQSRTDWKNRAHFFAIASRLTRQILVDHARRRTARKRGGDWNRRTAFEATVPVAFDPSDLLALNEALEDLEALNDRHRRVVELRFFGGLTIEETAYVLDVSPQTVKADWQLARAWLRARLES